MGVPERTGVAEVKVPASVSLEKVKGMPRLEMGGVIDTVIDGDLWTTPLWVVGYH